MLINCLTLESWQLQWEPCRSSMRTLWENIWPCSALRMESLCKCLKNPVSLQKLKFFGNPVTNLTQELHGDNDRTILGTLWDSCGTHFQAHWEHIRACLSASLHVPEKQQFHTSTSSHLKLYCCWSSDNLRNWLSNSAWSVSFLQ